MNAQTPLVKESKHDRFLRLMFKRLGRALDDLRLVKQLSSENYENTEAEAIEVLQHLDGSLKDIAASFGISYSSRIAGKAAAAAPKGPLQSGRPIDLTDIAKALELLSNDKVDDAKTLLKEAMMEGAR